MNQNLSNHLKALARIRELETRCEDLHRTIVVGVVMIAVVLIVVGGLLWLR